MAVVGKVGVLVIAVHAVESDTLRLPDHSGSTGLPQCLKGVYGIDSPTAIATVIAVTLTNLKGLGCFGHTKTPEQGNGRDPGVALKTDTKRGETG